MGTCGLSSLRICCRKVHMLRGSFEGIGVRAVGGWLLHCLDPEFLACSGKTVGAKAKHLMCLNYQPLHRAEGRRDQSSGSE